MTTQGDDVTTLWCSRCRTTVVSIPMDWGDREATISVALALDLMRACIQHGYSCPGRKG